MKKLTKNNQLESNLELYYVFALADKCPVTCHSIAGFAKNYPVPLPKNFLSLKEYVKNFFSHIDKAKINKITKVSVEDVEIYTAWRIWKGKRLNPKSLIFNTLCRNKALLIGNKSMEELHRSASRILRVKNQITEVINNCKDEDLAERLEEIKTATTLHTEIAIRFYNKVLENYTESLKEIDLYILEQQKLGGTNND